MKDRELSFKAFERMSPDVVDHNGNVWDKKALEALFRDVARIPTNQLMHNDLKKWVL
jgi:hypothetical protein